MSTFDALAEEKFMAILPIGISPEVRRTTGTVYRAGRPIRAKTYGKKRERGRHSYVFDPAAAVLSRYRYESPVYCVQS
jgi:hypothetical protein